MINNTSSKNRIIIEREKKNEKKKTMKILLIILAVVAVFVLFAYLFIKLYKPFGASPTKKDWKDYEKEAKISRMENLATREILMSNWDDPVDRFTRYAKENDIEYVAPILGETFNMKDYKNYQNEWWKNIN